MKKHLLSLIGISTLGLSVSAQTWTSANEPDIDASTILYLVDTTSANYASMTGADQTWDYSALGAYEDNTRIVSVTDTDDFSDDFPDATHMLLIPGFMNTAYTYEGFAGQKMVHGYKFELPDFGEVTFIFTDLQQMLEFPMSLGSTFTDDMEGTFTLFDEVNSAEGTTWVTADGTGTLLLANDVSHTGVLRIRTIDTLYADIVISGFPASVTIVRETFDYVKPGSSSFPLFSHATLKVLNPLIGEIKISFVLSSENPQDFVNIDNSELSEVRVFPNPSNGMFTVDFGAQEASVTVIDVTGRVVFESLNALNEVQVDLSAEMAGVYFVNIIRNGITTVEKVIIK